MTGGKDTKAISHDHAIPLEKLNLKRTSLTEHLLSNQPDWLAS